MKVLVTGDLGYIGTVLVPHLLKKGHQVIGIDADFYENSLQDSIKKKLHVQYKHVRKDIRNVVEKDLSGCDAVIHLAALSNDPTGEIDRTLTDEINYKASLRLAKLSKKAGVKRFLFSSSCSVYGIAKDRIVDELSTVNPQTAYAVSKIKVEKGLKKLADNSFCVGLLRNSTVYGYSPNFRDDLVVNNFVTCALALGLIRIMSDGTPWRPLIDIRDLSNIFIDFLTKDAKKINAEVINIGFNNSNYQVKDILAVVSKYIPKCELIYTGEHGSDTRSYQVSFNKFSKIFPEVRQKWTLDASVKDLVERLKKTGFKKEDFLKGKYTRITALKNAMQAKRLDKNLYRI